MTCSMDLFSCLFVCLFVCLTCQAALAHDKETEMSLNCIEEITLRATIANEMCLETQTNNEVDICQKLLLERLETEFRQCQDIDSLDIDRRVLIPQREPVPGINPLQVNTNNRQYWELVKENNPNADLIYIHIPKTGGTYVNTLLRQMDPNLDKLAQRGHTTPLVFAPGLRWTVLRHPVDRLESLLNYRLEKNCWFWSRDLYFEEICRNEEKLLNLDEVVDLLSDEELTSFTPFLNIYYYGRFADIFITIDKLDEFLSVFGLTDYEKPPNKTNVSEKPRGTFSEKTRSRIARLYADDMVIYEITTGRPGDI